MLERVQSENVEVFSKSQVTSYVIFPLKTGFIIVSTFRSC